MNQVKRKKFGSMMTLALKEAPEMKNRAMGLSLALYHLGRAQKPRKVTTLDSNCTIVWQVKMGSNLPVLQGERKKVKAANW